MQKLSWAGRGRYHRQMADDPSTRLERILAEAAADPEFREALLADRLAAVAQRGHPLDPELRSLLLATTDAQLRAVLQGLERIGEAGPPPGPPTACTGCRADLPPQVQGIRPDRFSPARGTRPGRVLVAAVAVSAVTAGAATMLLTAGNRPDPMPAAAKAQPHADAAAQDASPPDAGPDKEP